MILTSYLYWFIYSLILIRRHKSNSLIRHLDSFYCVLAIDVANGLAVVIWLNRSIYDDNITLVHSAIDHRDAIHAEKERGSLVLDQKFNQIQLLTNILRGRGKSRFNITDQLNFTRASVIYTMWYKLIHTEDKDMQN